MNAKNKSLIALTFVIILTVPMMMQLGQVFGLTTVNVPVYLYVNAGPNPVGVNQTVYISLFFSKPVPIVNATSFFLAATKFINLYINIVKPDGTNETLGPYTSDTSGGVGAVAYVPTAIGNYTLQGTFPGQSLGTNAAGQTFNMLPAMSPPVTLVVQQSPIPTYSSPPLPTNYWTRPIYASNYAWAQTIGGNWYGLGRPAFDNTGGYDASGNNFQPYSTAPTTAHILWTKPITTGGQPGGETVANQMSAYCANSPLYHYLEPVILNGVLFYNWYPAQTDMAGIVAVDLRTGQTLWVKNTTDTLIYGQVITFHNVEEFGSQALLWASNPNGNYDILDPVTGNYMASLTNIPSTISGLFATSVSALIDSNEPQCSGSILIYYVSGNNLTMWNSSYCLTAGASGEITEIYTGNYKPTGNTKFSQGIMWSVPLPSASPPFGIAAENNKAILLTSYPQVLSTFANQYGGDYATDVAYDPITGAKLWGPTNQTLTKFNELDLIAAGDGVYVRHNKDTNQLYGYSLTTGNQLWGPTQLVGNALSTIFASAAIAYGRVYIWDLGGYVNAVNVTTGKLDWTYTRGSAGYNTPYGVYPNWVFGTQSIADGMLFLSEGRCYDPPLFPGGEKLAINCTDGSLVWEISGAFQRDVCPIADGEMLGWNGYDGQIYGFGIGPSKTTVTAPGVGVTTSTPVTITGTVTDISAGSKQEAVAANFPNGLPCVSDASMTPWMEYVYMQQPSPSNATGVEVTLDAVDPNGNFIHLGTVTSDTSGTFGYAWYPPDVPGKYTIIATFAGSKSYYSSYAETYTVVSEAPATPTPAPPAQPLPPIETYFIVATVAIIIAIAIVGILLLRKRP